MLELNKKNIGRRRTRIGKITIEDLEKTIVYNSSNKGFKLLKTKWDELFGDISTKPNRKKLWIFKRNDYQCVKCGIKGSFFAIEHYKNNKKFHLNLYGLDKHGHPRLMTLDHGFPKSQGGSNKIKNLQCMCVKCNHKKGNKLEC